MGAEGTPAIGQTRTGHTLTQKSTGEVTSTTGTTGASHTAGGNPKGAGGFNDDAGGSGSSPYGGPPGNSFDNQTATTDSSVRPGTGAGGPPGSTRPTGPTTIAFPSNIGLAKDQRNYMTFTPFSIVGGFGSKREDGDYQMGNTVVALPIPTGITASYAHDWSQNDVDAWQSFAGEKTHDTLRNFGNTIKSGMTTEGSATTQTGPEQWATQSAGTHAQATISNLFNNWKEETKGMLATTAAGVLSNNPLVGRPLAQASGLAAFTETAIAYGGPAYREFGYTFRLMPGSATENIAIRNIINCFKINAAPVQHADSVYRVYSLPSVFEIKFFNHIEEHRHIPKIGKCALTNITVSFGGDRFATFTDGHPVQTDITLQFREIELLDRERTEAGY